MASALPELCAGAALCGRGLETTAVLFAHILYTVITFVVFHPKRFTRQEKTQTHFTEARAPAPTPAPSRRSPRPPHRHPRSPPSTALCLQLCARRRYPLLAPARRPKSAPARIHPRGSAWCPRAAAAVSSRAASTAARCRLRGSCTRSECRTACTGSLLAADPRAPSPSAPALSWLRPLARRGPST